VYDVAVIKAGQSGKYILKPQIAESGEDQEFKEVEGKEKPGKAGKPEVLEFEGTIQAIAETTWTVKIEGENRTVDVGAAEIEGEPLTGSQVKIEGTEENGNIVAEEIEVEEVEGEGESEGEEIGVEIEFEGSINSTEPQTIIGDYEVVVGEDTGVTLKRV